MVSARPPALSDSEYAPGPTASIDSVSSSRPWSEASASVTSLAVLRARCRRQPAGRGAAPPARRPARGARGCRPVCKRELEQRARASAPGRRRARLPRPPRSEQRAERLATLRDCRRLLARSWARRARPRRLVLEHANGSLTRVPRRRGSRAARARSRRSRSAQCIPHSFGAPFSHHQRPGARGSPGSTARVQGAQPIVV